MCFFFFSSLEWNQILLFTWTGLDRVFVVSFSLVFIVMLERNINKINLCNNFGKSKVVLSIHKYNTSNPSPREARSIVNLGSVTDQRFAIRSLLNQVHAVSLKQQGKQREHADKTLRSPPLLSAEFFEALRVKWRYSTLCAVLFCLRGRTKK